MGIKTKLLGLVLACGTCLPMGADAQVDTRLLNGNIDAGEVDTLIEQNASDPALAFDLLGIKVAGLTEDGDLASAADTIQIQVALLRRFPDLIRADLPALLLDAADLYLEADLPDRAIETLSAALDEYQDRAANADLRAELLRRMAMLEDARGRKDIAAQLRDRATDAMDPTAGAPVTRSDDAGFVRVNVYYATDRAPTGKTRPARMFGADRASDLNFGIAEVTIPRTHVPGALEAPSVWKLEFSENPAKHVMLQSVSKIGKDAFFATMRSDLDRSGARDAFVFVHGYNVSFDNAAKRTAQLAHDMNFRGLPILYSWPSKGATVGYIPDTAVVRLSGRRLTHFLEDVVAQSGARTIHLIAHSMGNRAMTDALELMALRNAPLTAPVFDQVIFAAPDIDSGLFAEMLPTIRPIAKRLTLYASDQDWALEASRKLHGNEPRAGQGGEVALLDEHIDTIDMSDLGQDMLAHSYVANEQSAILDISMLFWRNLDPANRCGLIGTSPEAPQQVWRYQKDNCSQANLLPLVATLRDQGAASKAQVRATLRQAFADADQVRALEQMLLNLATE